jgi:hypothetical protein
MRCMCAAVWLALGTAPAWARPFQDDVPTTPPAGRRPAEKQVREEDQRIYAALDEVVPEARLEDTPLEQVLKWVAESAKVNVHVEWRDLVDSGVDRDRPIALNLRGLPRWRVLRAVLDTASGEAHLGYEVRDGVLLIATRDWLDRDMITRVYPVRDLLYATVARWQRVQSVARPAPSAAGSPVDLAKATDAGYREELAKRSLMTTQPAAAPLDEALLPDAEAELLDLLRQSVAPDTWRENGGNGSGQIYNGVLVVRQCRTVHRAVERLLAELRATGAADSAPGVRQRQP